MEKEFAAKRASALIETLPYIREFFGKTVVIKVGGSIMDNYTLMSNLARNIVLLKYVGVLVLIILIKNTNPRVRIDQAMRFFWIWCGLALIAAIALAAVGNIYGIGWL